jgi:K+ potassium transporter
LIDSGVTGPGANSQGYSGISEDVEMDPETGCEQHQIESAWVTRSKRASRIILFIWILFGASCVVADGLLTPVVSITSAIDGSVWSRNI